MRITTDVDVDVDIEDFPDSEIIDAFIELEPSSISGHVKSLHVSYKKEALASIKILMYYLNNSKSDPLMPKSILDEAKLDYIRDVFDKYSLDDLKRLLP